MTAPNRLTRKGQLGRKKKQFPLEYRKHKSLGGIPMKIVTSKGVTYKQTVPYNYVYNKERKEYIDEEMIEREYAPLPEGEGSFIRRHIYEMRFDIKDESNKERRKREYKEWIERFI